VTDHQAAPGNAAQIEFWNSAATRAWADQYERMDGAVAALTEELVDLAAPQPGESVLDIGCGAGRQFLSWRGVSARAVMCLAQMSPSRRRPSARTDCGC
jgi:predicted RNA methylase